MSDQREKDQVHSAVLPGLVDIVEKDGEPYFFFVDKGEPCFIDKLETSTVDYIPPDKKSIPWLLPNADGVCKNFLLAKQDPKGFLKDLYFRILEYLKETVDLPSEDHYDLAVSWVFHSYTPELNEYSPIIANYAVPERGKSRFGKALIFMAYRGLYTESLREAYIIRVAKYFKASIFFDVVDFWKKAQAAGSEDVVITRYEKGATVPRVVSPDKGPHRDIVYYETFGATIVAVNEPLNEILETRCLQNNMPESSKLFSNQVRAVDGVPFKNALVVYRALFGSQEFEDVEKPVRGRLGDITRPLIQTVRRVCPEREENLRRLIKRIELERKVDVSASLDAQILAVVCRMQRKAERGQLPVKLVTDMFNSDRPERFRYTYQFMGKKLASLGFQKASTNTGCATILLDPHHLKNVFARYGVLDTGETGVPGETGDWRPPVWQRTDADTQKAEQLLREQLNPSRHQ